MIENNPNITKGIQGNQLAPDQQNKHEAIENFGNEKLNNFANSLHIKWKINVTDEEGRLGAAIHSNPFEKTHEILLSKNIRQNIEDNLPDITHELCHARFSEELDPIYSTIRFPKHYGELAQDSREYKDFVAKARMIETTQAWVDIWINELRNNLWPELTAEENDKTMASLSKLQQTGNLLSYWNDKYTLMVAMILAEQTRNKGKLYPIAPIKNALGNEWRKIKKLQDLFEKLPHFTNGKTNFTEQAKTKGLVEFERVVREVAIIFNYPIRPTIKREALTPGAEENVNVWDFK